MQGGLNCALPRQAWPSHNKLNVNKHLDQIENSPQVILSRISNTLASDVPRLDSAIHRINHYLVDKYQGNQYNCTILSIDIYPVDSVMHLLNNWGQINLCPVDSAIFNSFPHTHPMDSDLSGGQRYLTFEQLEPDEKHKKLPRNGRRIG